MLNWIHTSEKPSKSYCLKSLNPYLSISSLPGPALPPSATKGSTTTPPSQHAPQRHTDAAAVLCRCVRCAAAPPRPPLTDLWPVRCDLVEAHHGGGVRNGPQGFLKIGCRLTPALLIGVVVVRDDVAALLLVCRAGAPRLALHAVCWYCNDNGGGVMGGGVPGVSRSVNAPSLSALSSSMWELRKCLT